MLSKIQKCFFPIWTFHITWYDNLLQDYTKNTPKLSIFDGVFPTLPHTHWERQAVHKLMISSEMTSQSLTELHEVFERRTLTIAQHVSDVLWCSLESALVRFSNTDENIQRKMGDRRSGEMSYRDIPLKKTKNRAKILKKMLPIFWRDEHGGLRTFST